MSIWKRQWDLSTLNHFVRNTAISHLKIEFVEIGKDFLVATIPVEECTKQPWGTLHGGVSCLLAETIGSTAGFLALPEPFYCLGLELNANHIRTASSGLLTATARPFHLGRSTQVWSVEIMSQENKLICISRVTNMVLTKEEK